MSTGSTEPISDAGEFFFNTKISQTSQTWSDKRAKGLRVWKSVSRLTENGVMFKI